MKWRNLWLCVPVLFVVLVDGAITLLGQPDAYWSGGFRAAREGFPLFGSALSMHPMAFVALGVLWILLFSAAICLSPPPLSEILCVALVVGHTHGAVTWLDYRFGVNYHIILLLLVIPSTIFVFCHTVWRTRPAQPPPSSDVENDGGC